MDVWRIILSVTFYSCICVEAWQDRSTPSAPILSSPSKTWTSIQVEWVPQSDGGDPIRGYKISYRSVEGSGKHSIAWKEKTAGARERSMVLDGLYCETSYEIFGVAFNDVGTGATSATITQTTEPDYFTRPAKEDFIVEAATQVTLRLQEWHSECGIERLEAEFKKVESDDWTVVSRNFVFLDSFVLPGLTPSTWYDLRIGVVPTNEDIRTYSYKFATLSTNGVIPPPTKTMLITEATDSVVIHLNEWKTTKACPVDRFRVDYRDEATEEWTHVHDPIDVSQDQLVVRNLVSDTDYEFRITAESCGESNIGTYNVFTGDNSDETTETSINGNETEEDETDDKPNHDDDDDDNDDDDDKKKDGDEDDDDSLELSTKASHKTIAKDPAYRKSDVTEDDDNGDDDDDDDKDENDHHVHTDSDTEEDDNDDDTITSKETSEESAESEASSRSSIIKLSLLCLLLIRFC